MNTLAEVLQVIAERTRFAVTATVTDPPGQMTEHQLLVRSDIEWRHRVDGVEQPHDGTWLQECPRWLVELVRTWDVLAALDVDHVSHRPGGVIVVEGVPLPHRADGGCAALAQGATRMSIRLDGHRGAITHVSVERADGVHVYDLDFTEDV